MNTLSVKRIIAIAVSHLVILSVNALTLAEEVKPSPAQQSAAALDKILDDLAQLDPKVLSDRLLALQGESGRLQKENNELRAKIARNDQELSKLGVQVGLLDALVKARAMMSPTTQPATTAKKPPAPAKPAAKPEAAPAAAAQKPAPPAPAKVEAPAPPSKDVVVNFQDHILPLVNERCASCHKPDKSKAELVLTTYEGAMKGSENGAVIVKGNPAESLLFKVINHEEEPHMPPKQGKLDTDKLELIKRWIAAGAPADAKAATPAAEPKKQAANDPAETPAGS